MIMHQLRYDKMMDKLYMLRTKPIIIITTASSMYPMLRGRLRVDLKSLNGVYSARLQDVESILDLPVKVAGSQNGDVYYIIGDT